jgi:hypothetical protein
MREVKERLKLDNVRNDHVIIQSELKYLIGAKLVNLKGRVFGGKNWPICICPGFRMVLPAVTVQFCLQPDPDPTREFGPIPNTLWNRYA